MSGPFHNDPGFPYVVTHHITITAWEHRDFYPLPVWSPQHIMYGNGLEQTFPYSFAVRPQYYNHGLGPVRPPHTDWRVRNVAQQTIRPPSSTVSPLWTPPPPSTHGSRPLPERPSDAQVSIPTSRHPEAAKDTPSEQTTEGLRNPIGDETSQLVSQDAPSGEPSSLPSEHTKNLQEMDTPSEQTTEGLRNPIGDETSQLVSQDAPSGEPSSLPSEHTENLQEMNTQSGKKTWALVVQGSTTPRNNEVSVPSVLQCVEQPSTLATQQDKQGGHRAEPPQHGAPQSGNRKKPHSSQSRYPQSTKGSKGPPQTVTRHNPKVSNTDPLQPNPVQNRNSQHTPRMNRDLDRRNKSAGDTSHTPVSSMSSHPDDGQRRPSNPTSSEDTVPPSSKESRDHQVVEELSLNQKNNTQPPQKKKSTKAAASSKQKPKPTQKTKLQSSTSGAKDPKLNPSHASLNPFVSMRACLPREAPVQLSKEVETFFTNLKSQVSQLRDIKIYTFEKKNIKTKEEEFKDEEGQMLEAALDRCETCIASLAEKGVSQSHLDIINDALLEILRLTYPHSTSSKNVWSVLLGPYHEAELPSLSSQTNDPSNPRSRDVTQLRLLCTIGRVSLVNMQLRSISSKLSEVPLQQIDLVIGAIDFLFHRYKTGRALIWNLQEDPILLQYAPDEHPITQLIGVMEQAYRYFNNKQGYMQAAWMQCVGETASLARARPEYMSQGKDPKSAAKYYNYLCALSKEDMKLFLQKDMSTPNTRAIMFHEQLPICVTFYATALYLDNAQHQLGRIAVNHVLDWLSKDKSLSKSPPESSAVSSPSRQQCLYLSGALYQYSIHCKKNLKDSVLAARCLKGGQIMFELAFGQHIKKDPSHEQRQLCYLPSSIGLGDALQSMEWTKMDIKALHPWCFQDAATLDQQHPDEQEQSKQSPTTECRDTDEQRNAVGMPMEWMRWAVQYAVGSNPQYLQYAWLGRHDKYVVSDRPPYFAACIPEVDREKCDASYKDKRSQIESSWKTYVTSVEKTLSKPISIKVQDIESIKKDFLEFVTTAIQDIAIPELQSFIRSLEKVGVDSSMVWLWQQLGCQWVQNLALRYYVDLSCNFLLSDLRLQPHQEKMKTVLLKLQDRSRNLNTFVEKKLVDEAALSAFAHKKVTGGDLQDKGVDAMRQVLQQRPCIVNEGKAAYLFPWVTGDPQDSMPHMSPLSIQELADWENEFAPGTALGVLANGLQTCLTNVQQQTASLYVEQPISAVPISDEQVQRLQEIPWIRSILPEQAKDVDRMALFTLLTHAWIRHFHGGGIVIERSASSDLGLRLSRSFIRAMAETAFDIVATREQPPVAWDELIEKEVLSSFPWVIGPHGKDVMYIL